MYLFVNTETINSRWSDGKDWITYTEFNPYYNTTTKTIQYKAQENMRPMLTTGEKTNMCRFISYLFKNDYVTAAQSSWEQILLKTPFGRAKGVSYSKLSRMSDWEDGDLQSCKVIRVALFGKHYSGTHGQFPELKDVITYGVSDMLSEIGGLYYTWVFTFGSITSFFMYRAFRKKMKEENIKEIVSFDGIKRVSDDVDVLKADKTKRKKRITDLESQLKETCDDLCALEADSALFKSRIGQLESHFKKSSRVQRASVSILV